MKYNLYFTGDTLLKDRNGECNVFDNVRSIFSDSDLTLINLETVVSDKAFEENQKDVNICCSKKNIKSLNKIKCNFVNIANNHILDYKEEGLKDTILSLDENAIDYIGIKDNKTFIKEIDNIKIAFIGIYEKNINSNNTVKISYLNKNLFEDISKLSTKVDFVIVNIHWGVEFSKLPKPKQRKIAHKLIDCGASLIIGHHPHIIQGKEMYKGKNIYYSLGNFNFFKTNRNFDADDNKGIIVKCELDKFKRNITVSEIPIYIDENWIPNKAKDDVKDIFIERSEKIKKMRFLDFYEEIAEIYFANNYDAWKNRIKKYGIKQFFLMIIWTIIKPFNYMCLLGIVSKKLKKDKI